MAWLSVPSTIINNSPDNAQPRFRRGSTGPPGDTGATRIVGRLATTLIAKNVRKFRPSTDDVRPNTRPTRNSPTAKRSADSEAYVMAAPSIWRKPYQDFVARGRLVVHPCR